jgi:hypothetical protein
VKVENFHINLIANTHAYVYMNQIAKCRIVLGRQFEYVIVSHPNYFGDGGSYQLPQTHQIMISSGQMNSSEVGVPNKTLHIAPRT